MAFEILIEALKDWKTVIVNLEASGSGFVGGFALPACNYVGTLVRFLLEALGPRSVVYLTLAQSGKGFLRDFVFIWLSVICGHDIIGHVHGGSYDHFFHSQSRLFQWVIRQSLKRARIIIVLSEKLRGMFGFEPSLKERIAVIPNGLPENEYGRPKTLPSDAGSPVKILYLSNLIESKGFLDVLSAIKVLRDRGHRVEAHFCGAFTANPADDIRVKDAESARNIFFDFVRSNKLEPMIFFQGTVDGERKRQALEDAHFFVLPTNYIHEGQPISIIEAMAQGCVVVTTDYRGISELIEEDKTGLFVPYGSPHSIAAKIEACIASPAGFAEISMNAIEAVRAKFSREAHVSRMLRILGVGSDLR